MALTYSQARAELTGLGSIPTLSDLFDLVANTSAEIPGVTPESTYLLYYGKDARNALDPIQR